MAERWASELLEEVEGLDLDEKNAVTLALAHGLRDAVDPQRLKEYDRAGAATFPLTGDDPTDVARLMTLHQAGVLAGLKEDVAGFTSTSSGVDEGKLAVRRALAVLSQANPRILAAAIGVSQPTLYACSDLERTQRPGPQRLFRAAYLFELLGKQMLGAAEQLREAARTAKPVRRGRPAKEEREGG